MEPMSNYWPNQSRQPNHTSQVPLGRSIPFISQNHPQFKRDITPLITDVFISYSRNDKAFVEKLTAALESTHRRVWVDWQDILPTAQWLGEIFAGIEAASTFILVLSPDSVTSRICLQEVVHAVQMKKRIIPLVYRVVDSENVLEPLRELNWIYFRETDSF